jgi:hypothetical protein
VILPDASVWIDLFRTGAGRDAMARLMATGQVTMHPCLVAELALDSLKNRNRTLRDLDLLPQLRVATLAEVRAMIEARELHARGIGLTDAHLIASCLMTPGTRLWTLDRRLASVASELGVLYATP